MLPSPAAAPSPWAPSPHPTTLPITAPSPAPAQPHRRAASVRTGLALPGAGLAGAGATTSTGGHGIVVEEPSVEATRNVAVLLGAGTEDEGLLDRVEREVEAVLKAYERAFGAGIAAQAGTSRSKGSPPRSLSLELTLAPDRLFAQIYQRRSPPSLLSSPSFPALPSAASSPRPPVPPTRLSR